jgi:polyribonucleotide nucleotidyltransferase
MSHDLENDPDILGMVAASAALTLSGLPFLGPIGAARVGVINGEFVLNPMVDEMKDSVLDLVVAGTTDAVMMVESEAKELPEAQMLDAVMFGHKHMQPVIQAIIKLAEKAAKEPWDIKIADKSKYAGDVKKIAEKTLKEAFSTKEKGKRQDLVSEAKKAIGEGVTLAADTADEKVLQVARNGHHARRRFENEAPHRRPRPEDGPPDFVGGSRSPAHARLGALYTRRDAGACRRNARHRRRRAVYRQPRRHEERALLAAL